MGDDDGKAGGETSRTGVLAVQGEVSRVLNERNGIRGSVREKEGGCPLEDQASNSWFGLYTNANGVPV